MEIKIKDEKREYDQIKFTGQENFNQIYINDLIKIKKTMTSVPDFVPRKLIDQFQIVLTGGSYYLYIYTNDTTPGTWKRVTIS